jgi:signal transduction histidine kinase
MTEAERMEQLAAALRSAASRAAETASGGCALLFVLDADAESVPRLRAAAGFPSPEAARAAAGRLVAAAKEAMQQGRAQACAGDPALGDRCAGSLWTWPLALDERVHGALVVGSPVELDEERRARLAEVAAHAGLSLDHGRVARELAELQARVSTHQQLAEEKSDEVLRLSEALFAQDIELLRNNEKLGKVEKLKNDFIEKMSRELRTPLNSIIESIISVLAGENEAISDAAKESLRRALDEGTAFQRTLQNILDLWRVKQGELPVEKQEVNFREVVEEAIFSVQDTLGDKPVVIEKQLAQPFPKIRTDLAKINQVLFLLLDNAAKFTDEGKITIRAEARGDDLVCSISDTGIGICPDDQQFIFDEFYQVDELSSTRYRGAGLGLALVRDLLVLLGGEISLSSEVGKGTTVRFRVPVECVG